MPPAAFHLRATMLPYGDTPCDLWVAGGRVRTRPIDGAEPLAPEGGYVLPGLVDAHVHLVTNRDYKDLPAGSREVVDRNRGDFLRRGVLLLRDMGAFTRREAERPATLGLPRDDGLPPVIASGQPLAPAGVFTGIQEPTAPEQLEAHATHRARDQHSPWVKVILDNFPPHFAPAVDGVPGMVNYREPELRAATEAVHAAGARIAVHAFTHEAAATAVAAGVDSIEHGWGLDAGLVEELARHGIAWTPTLALDEMMLDMAAGGRGRPPSKAVDRWLRDAIDRIEPLIVRARRLGVPLLAGTDGVEPVTREVARLQQAGLEPADALATASSAARELLGEPGLEDGAPADLVWFADDPRESPELLERPDLVLLRGERVDLARG
ncbi:MAG: amidohydrolase family protein [Chloroflexi bacterium]|nr:amidohydrolase family protein [Chloroflexota bacterium]